MPKLNFVIIAERAIVNEKNNNLDIFGIFDTVFAPGFPAVHPFVSIITNKELESGTHKEYFILKKDGQIIYTSPEHSYEVALNAKRHQFIFNVNNLPLPEPGEYTVEIYLDKQFLGASYFLAAKK